MLVSLITLLVGAALASPGLDALSDGDRARYADDRVTAAARYQEAIDSGEPAAEAMARLRMLSLSGNLGALWHGPSMDRAIARIEASPGDPWGELAIVDYHLMAPMFVGADREEGLRRAYALLDELPGPAAARLYLATGQARWLTALEESERDGMGDGILDSQRRSPPDPGTWFLGIGASGAPGQGVGGGLILKHPDLARRRWWFSTTLGATSRGSVNGAVTLRSPHALHGDLSLSGYRLVSDVYDGDTRLTYVLSGAHIRLGPGYRFSVLDGRSRIWVAGQIRTDDLGTGPLTMWGPTGGASWSDTHGSRGGRRGKSLSVSSAWGSGGDYQSLQFTADSRLFIKSLGGALGMRLNYRNELSEDAPFFLLPYAGGSVFHRGAWTARWQAPQIATADLEQRWSLGNVLEPVIFTNLAWVIDEGFHPGGGVGIRLVLPPENLNIVRLDLGISDTAWGLYVGWGEVF